MKMSFKTLLVAAATFVTLGTTSCSQKLKDKAGAATDNAAAAANNAGNAGNAVENTANNVKADMAREKGDTAVVVNKPADKVIEKMPATQK